MRKSIGVAACFLLIVPHLMAQSGSSKHKTDFKISIPLVYNTGFFNYDHNNRKRVNETRGFGVGAGLSHSWGTHAITLAGNYQFGQNLLLAESKELKSNQHHTENLFFDLNYSRKINNRINLIGGIGVGKYKYMLRNIFDGNFLDLDSSFQKNDYVMGPNVGIELMLNKFLSADILYRSGLISFGAGHYFHNVSLGFNVYPLRIKGNLPKRERPGQPFRNRRKN
ncbi:hypothetical protein ABDK00_010600 [Niabella insulamsoli]|uniref:hypothetical protein n=1 Tax=Niabella insulamsoli TaxID=3144874 RepID=UPI0031FC4CC5